jgi:hypothetical protein
MRKAAGKRFPHGVTSDLVLSALWQIHLHSGRAEPVSRADLVKAACLPETTVDDRLRVLLKMRKVLKVGRGLYSPIQQKDKSSHSPNRYLAGLVPSAQPAPEKVAQQPMSPGTKRVVVFPEGVVLVERWFSLDEYQRAEARRRRLEGFGVNFDDFLGEV